MHFNPKRQFSSNSDFKNTKVVVLTEKEVEAFVKLGDADKIGSEKVTKAGYYIQRMQALARARCAVVTLVIRTLPKNCLHYRDGIS